MVAVKDVAAEGVLRTSSPQLPKLLLCGILLAAFGLRVACALLFKNINHVDEIFQYVEPAHRTVFGYGLVEWEFQMGARSWLVPGFVAGIIELASRLSDNPAVYLGAIGITMSALSLSVVVVAFFWGQRLYGTIGAVITASLAAGWFELVYYAPHALTDVLAADALVLAVFLVYPETERRSPKAFLVCGLLLGLGFALRYPLAPVYLLVALYVCRGWVKERWLPLAAGAAASVLAAGVLDALTWGYPFHSILMPLSIGYSAVSHEPWYWYAGVLTLEWSGALVPLIGLACLGARRLPFLGLLTVFIFVFFSAIGLKVHRYVYPALPFLIVLTGLGTSDLVVRLAAWYPRREPVLVSIAVAGWLVTSASLAVSDHFRIFLFKDGAIVDAFDRIGKRADLCGLAVVGLESWHTAGYTHLHRDVPMYLVPSDEIASRAESFNYVIGTRAGIGNPSQFSRESCTPNATFNPVYNEICVYHRPGRCVPSTERTMQGAMRN